MSVLPLVLVKVLVMNLTVDLVLALVAVLAVLAVLTVLTVLVMTLVYSATSPPLPPNYPTHDPTHVIFALTLPRTPSSTRGRKECLGAVTEL